MRICDECGLVLTDVEHEDADHPHPMRHIEDAADGKRFRDSTTSFTHTNPRPPTDPPVPRTPLTPVPNNVKSIREAPKTREQDYQLLYDLDCATAAIRTFCDALDRFQHISGILELQQHMFHTFEMLDDMSHQLPTPPDDWYPSRGASSGDDEDPTPGGAA